MDYVRLVVVAQQGDQEAFGELYVRFSRFVHGLLLARLQPQDAADLTQDVFLQAWSTLTTLRDPAAFGGWLGTIARRLATDHLRHQREQTGLDKTASQPGTQHASAEAIEVLQAIGSLPEAYRDTLVLRLVEGFSGPEIARLSGLTPDSVRVNLHRGFKMLRERLAVKQ